MGDKYMLRQMQKSLIPDTCRIVCTFLNIQDEKVIILTTEAEQHVEHSFTCVTDIQKYHTLGNHP